MIEENRNSIVIRNVDVESKQYEKFERAFSLYNTVTHKYEYHTYVQIDQDIHLPASVGASVIQSYFPKKQVSQNFVGTPLATTIQFSVIHQPRDTIQSEALTFLLGIKKDSRMRSRMLNLRTGMGKTYVTIAALSKLAQRAMIIVDSVDLAQQWKNQILFHSTLTEDDVFIISGKESVEQAKMSSCKIFIAIHKTLGMLLDDDLNSINNLNHKLKIGVRVFDECHVDFHNICMINALSNVNYTIYLTATPNRSDYKEDMLYSKIFDNIPSYDGHKKENERYHKIVLCYYNTHPTDKQKASVKTKYGFCVNKWANFVETDDCYIYYRDSLIAILNQFKLIETKKKVAIMLPTIDLIEKTKTDLLATYPEISLGTYNSEIKKNDRQDEIDKQVILTTQKIFGKAIDVRVYFTSIKSKRNA